MSKVMNSLRSNYSDYLVGAYERLSKEDDRRDESSSIRSQKMIIESFTRFHDLKTIRHCCDDGLLSQILIDQVLNDYRKI